MLAIEAILKADTMWEEGRRGTEREIKRKKTLAPAHRNQTVFHDTLKKRGWSPPHQKSCNRITYPLQAVVCAVLCFLTSEEEKMPFLRG